MAPGVVARFAIDRHRILIEHGGSVKEGPMMLAAVETMTKADPVWKSRRHYSDVAAQATAREPVHTAPPLMKRSESLQRTVRALQLPLRLRNVAGLLVDGPDEVVGPYFVGVSDIVADAILGFMS
jgi:hypothetical protein